MENPYSSRLLKAMEHLLKQGVITSQREFCDALEIPQNYIAGFRNGSRKVFPHHIYKLNTKYHVSLYYLCNGNLPVMEKEIQHTTPEDESEIAANLAAARATVELQEKIIAAKDAEINFLRELLKLELNKLQDKGGES